MFVEKQLTDVHENVSKNIKDLMKRGETIEELMLKSKDLSTHSVNYYAAAKKHNPGHQGKRCC